MQLTFIDFYIITDGGLDVLELFSHLESCQSLHLSGLNVTNCQCQAKAGGKLRNYYI